MTELTFTLKDLIIIAGILTPAIISILYMKWKQNILESRIIEGQKRHEEFKDKIEQRHEDFKKYIYNKLEENSANLHRIELSIANLKTEFLQTILEAISKIK